MCWAACESQVSCRTIDLSGSEDEYTNPLVGHSLTLVCRFEQVHGTERMRQEVAESVWGWERQCSCDRGEEGRRVASFQAWMH